MIEQGLLRSCCAALLLAAAAWAHAATAPEEVDPAIIDALARSMASEAADGDHFDAQVWLLSSVPKLARYVADDSERTTMLKSIYRESSRQQLDPDLVLAVMQVESAFDRYAVSRVGAQGLMQVMPFWRNEIGRPQDNLTEIETNIRYGTTILAHYLSVARGDLIDALARYNGSRGRLDYPELVVYAYRARWQTQSNDQLPTLQAGCMSYSLVACAPITKRR
jgi:soluble lytic murein transglycosylase-like protein